MTSEPLVSVCIPAYNCEKYIAGTLNCLVSQTYRNIEIIVVNDGSTDNTLAEARKVNDDRITILDVANGGASRARNIAYKNSTGSQILFFDADDYIEPDFIQQQVSLANSNEKDVVMANWGRFYEDDLATFSPECIEKSGMDFREWITIYWFAANPMTNPGRALIPRSLKETSGLWNESLSLNDDLEFFTRLFANTHKIIFNRESFLYYRSGVRGLSGEKGLEAYQSLYDSIALSVQVALTRYPNDNAVKQSCANMWQSFIYEVYPHQPGLLKLAAKALRSLPSPKIPFPAGGVTKLLTNLVGWRKAKRIKLMLS